MSKHTPGPWAYSHNSWEFSDVYGTDGKVVATCQIDEDVTEETQEMLETIKEANARLIAAAPDLLEALQACADWLDWLVVPPIDPKDAHHAHLKLARAAIAKATGKTK
jgi:hypothetical protein